MNIESILSSAKISRDYVSSYAAAASSIKLDGKLFADLPAQHRFFSKKLTDAKDAHRANLNGALGTLTAARQKATDEKGKAKLNVAIAALGLELASL